VTAREEQRMRREVAGSPCGARCLLARARTAALSLDEFKTTIATAARELAVPLLARVQTLDAGRWVSIESRTLSR
jgi:hypothetical protein